MTEVGIKKLNAAFARQKTINVRLTEAIKIEKKLLRDTVAMLKSESLSRTIIGMEVEAILKVMKSSPKFMDQYKLELKKLQGQGRIDAVRESFSNLL